MVSKATRYYREQCALHGWEPSPEQIIYRANILLEEATRKPRRPCNGGNSMQKCPSPCDRASGTPS